MKQERDLDQSKHSDAKDSGVSFLDRGRLLLQQFFALRTLGDGGLDGFHDVGGDIGGSAVSIDRDHDVLVGTLDGGNVGVELFETDDDLFFGIVAAVFQSGNERFVVGGWRGKGQVVDLSGFGIGAAPDDAFDQDLVGDVQEQEAIGGAAGVGKGLGLCGGTGESIEQPTLLLAVGFVETVTDDADDDFVGDELSAVHEFLGLDSDIGAGSDGRTKHVSGRQVDDAEFFFDDFALRALSAGGGTGDDDVHGRARGSFVTGSIVGAHSSSRQPFLLLLPLGGLLGSHFEDDSGTVGGRGGDALGGPGVRRRHVEERRRRCDGGQGDEQESRNIHGAVCALLYFFVFYGVVVVVVVVVLGGGLVVLVGGVSLRRGGRRRRRSLNLGGAFLAAFLVRGEGGKAAPSRRERGRPKGTVHQCRSRRRRSHASGAGPCCDGTGGGRRRGGHRRCRCRHRRLSDQGSCAAGQHHCCCGLLLLLFFRWRCVRACWCWCWCWSCCNCSHETRATKIVVSVSVCV
mmetsp:Transcript_65162/g.132552  ORF Transcript_65162/g.132552 Transcript_65162/m.132552 type:complete len:515 (+) Transcript_65162:119-1663(+)